MAEETLNQYKTDEFGGLAEAAQSGQVFRRFKPKDVAARQWINDLIQNGYRTSKSKYRRTTEEGLFMSDEMQDVGIMSIAPSLSALLLELSLLKNDGDLAQGGVSFKNVVTNSKVQPVIINSIYRLLTECYPDGLDGDAVLSSMPFYDDSAAAGNNGWDKGGYLDSASWAFLAADSVESFFNRLESVLAPEEFEKIKWDGSQSKDVKSNVTLNDIKKAVRKLYLSCIRIACDCMITDEHGVRGWTFRKMGKGAEPSLYFSYVASTVYLGLYKRFDGKDGLIDKLRAFEAFLENSRDESKRKFKFYDGIKNPEKLDKAISKIKGFAEDCGIESDTGKMLKAFAEMLERKKSEKNGIEELDLLYNVINNGQPLTRKVRYDELEFTSYGAFTLLKDALVKFAGKLWNSGFGDGDQATAFKVNMAAGPCFEDGTLVDLDAVKKSSQNNAVFNNLFVIGIILNAAYDAELKREDVQNGTNEYDKMLDTFRVSLQNTQRFYNEVENAGLLYKIDSYILDFSDKVDERNLGLAKQLRKVNMSVVPLLPLMLKNNNLMSEYVVRYPQKEMTESLKDIIRNRKQSDEGVCWVWDKDGYNAITNYYYVDALIAFYRYYESFEAQFVENETKNLDIEKQIDRRVKEGVDSAVTTLNAEHGKQLKKLDSYISEVRGICKGMARLVINGLIDIVDEQLTDSALLGALDDGEREHTGKIVRELKSFTDDGDAVKITKLLEVFDKLRILSLLSLTEKEDADITQLLKTGDVDNKSSYSHIIRDVLGADKERSSFLLRILKSFMHPVTPSGSDDNK